MIHGGCIFRIFVDVQISFKVSSVYVRVSYSIHGHDIVDGIRGVRVAARPRGGRTGWVAGQLGPILSGDLAIVEVSSCEDAMGVEEGHKDQNSSVHPPVVD